MSFEKLYAYCLNCGIRRVIRALNLIEFDNSARFCSTECAVEWGQKMSKSVLGLDNTEVEEWDEEPSEIKHKENHE